MPPANPLLPLADAAAARTDPLSSGADNGAATLRTFILVIGAALLASIAILYAATGNLVLIALVTVLLIGAGALLYLYQSGNSFDYDQDWAEPDWSITHDAAAHPGTAVVISDRAGRMTCANATFSDWFGADHPPPKLPLSGDGADRLAEAGRAAWRDGSAFADGLIATGRTLTASVHRIGRGEDYLLWRFEPAPEVDLIGDAMRMLSGKPGRALSREGLMAAIVSPEGLIRAANDALSRRVTGRDSGKVIGRDLAEFLRLDERNRIFFHASPSGGAVAEERPITMVHVPLLDPDRSDVGHASDESTAPALIMLFEANQAMVETAGGRDRVESLLAPLPMGLAMVDRDGRFLFANPAFMRAAGRENQRLPSYPGDIVVAEDKGALSNAVRRFSSGRQASGDVTVRLSHQPDEPVSIGLASIRGMGEAAVLLSVKDSTEESKLKRQVAQQTKMQAVGQLAGGVAHDFNNVLTAIIGHCDLMLMRHGPGDSDYDDIQQIKSNSNRAAALTRQLLAFSRQQTLRPQLLQLPDIVSDVSSLLKRLMGDKIRLEVVHARNLGVVRADPGQLEQVIVNLAVNARDAMLSQGQKASEARGEGRYEPMLTIRTERVEEKDVRAMDADVLPPGRYSALIIQDNGSGIPPDVQAKIFEPFFTTKDVGKGTGLGLSTVYGIVKQSGGYIFVDSQPGKGARFTIYLPVHEGDGVEAAAKTGKSSAAALPKSASQWGFGTILLVEDEDMVRGVAEQALTRQGYSVVTACDGEEGLDHIAAGTHFDLVISDVVMPVMDGPSMVRKIREVRPDLPVLFMSGYAEEQLRQTIDLDQVGFLPKPFSVAEIADAVGAILQAQ